MPCNHLSSAVLNGSLNVNITLLLGLFGAQKETRGGGAESEGGGSAPEGIPKEFRGPPHFI